MRFVIAVFLLASVSCSTSPTEPAPANGTISIRFGQTAIVGGTRISFTDVTDSRCPKDVVCAWEGDAAVRLESGAEAIVLHTTRSAGPAEGVIAGLNVTLLQVRPERVSSEEPARTAYVVSLRVASR